MFAFNNQSDGEITSLSGFKICDALAKYVFQIPQIQRFGLGLGLYFVECIPEQVEIRALRQDARRETGS